MPSAKHAVVLLGPPGHRQSGYGDPLIIAVAPSVGATLSPNWPRCRVTMPPGYKPCRKAYRTAPLPRRCRRSATSTSLNSRQSFRPAASAEIESCDLPLCTESWRLPRRLLQTTPLANPRSPRLRNPDQLRRGERYHPRPSQGGQFWTPIRGHFSTPIDTPSPPTEPSRSAEERIRGMDPARPVRRHAKGDRRRQAKGTTSA
jgi:hypothetical protein